MVHVNIEKAIFDDLSQFAAMEKETGTCEFIDPYPHFEHQSKFSDPTFVYLRITNDGVIVGFFILVFDSDGYSIEFRRMVVSEKDKGIGQAAMRQMEAFCRDELGRSRIWLDVFADNQKARHIYEKLGFVRFGESEFIEKQLLLYEKRID